MTLEIITTPEQDEIFAKHYVRHGDALQAATQARIYVMGYDTRDIAEYNLHRDVTKQAIAKATAAKTAPVAVEITRESIVNDFQEVYEKALLNGEYTPAITAKKAIAQLHGLLDQNVTLTVKNDVTGMTDAQLEKIIAARGAKVIDGTFKDVTPRQGIAALGVNGKG